MPRHCTLFLCLIAATIFTTPTQACTDFLFTRGATTDGSTIITYMADSYYLYGELYYHAPSVNPPGTTLGLYHKDGIPQITIPQPEHCFNVVGYINDHQVAMGESTFTGRRELWATPQKGIDYGTLIWIVLQRVTSARQAIVELTTLLDRYGYCNNGESFSISDTAEVWILELMSKRAEYDTVKGKPVLKKQYRGYRDGAVWVARRVPDGYVCGHANQARITTFPQEPTRWNKTKGQGLHRAISSRHLDYIYEPEVECVYSDDVIAFARMRGYFDGKDEDFSFADAYNPLEFETIRACDARIYAMFLKLNKDVRRYERYAMGDATAERLPLWIKPEHKVSIHDVMQLTRDHYEGTLMDMTQGIGAGEYGCPYRALPLRWSLDGNRYVNERPVSTQQTGFSLIAQCRANMPDKLGGILWFGVDDTYSTVYCPLYCGITVPPECFRQGNGSLTRYSTTSAFWLFNRVANFAYSRYSDMIKDIQQAQFELETSFIQAVADFDHKAANANDSTLVAMENNFCSNLASQMMNRWTALDQYLLMKYMDLNAKESDDRGNLRLPSFGTAQQPLTPNHSTNYYRQLVNERGHLIGYPQNEDQSNSQAIPDNY
ncbi:MAG: C69 family dipeptidase [Bacteroidales bacterium]|nr:C69 family dipeptidase [Bacteroidales bacterium]